MSSTQRTQTLFKSLIPPELLHAWMRGEYVLGTATDEYRYTGFALMLRGFYRYRVWQKIERSPNPQSNDPPLFGGIAVTYLPSGYLTFAGIRLFENDGTDTPVRPLFWRSVFSTFVESQGGSQTEIHFSYRVFPDAKILKAHPVVELVEKFRASCAGDQSMDPLTALEADKRQCHAVLLSFSDFLRRNIREQDVSIGKSELRGLCVLTPPTRPEKSPSTPPSEDLSGPKSDLTVPGEYYGVFGDSGLAEQGFRGKVEFSRYSRSFLDSLS